MLVFILIHITDNYFVALLKSGQDFYIFKITFSQPYFPFDQFIGRLHDKQFVLSASHVITAVGYSDYVVLYGIEHKYICFDSRSQDGLVVFVQLYGK